MMIWKNLKNLEREYLWKLVENKRDYAQLTSDILQLLSKKTYLKFKMLVSFLTWLYVSL
jgi:hypothetical protein